MLQGPVQHPAHGGVLGIQPPGSGHLAGAGRQPRHGVLGHPQRVPGQRGRDGVTLAGLGQQPRPVSPQRLQHHVPGPAIRAGPRRDQQRAVHQMQHGRPRASPRDRLGPLQRERPREHRHRAEHPPLPFIQQPVTPLHGGRQRPLPRRGEPVPVLQQREPVIDPVQQLRHAQRLDPRRRQLDRQRHPVQPRHQPRHHRRGLPIQRETRVSPAGPVREQRHRLRPVQLRRIIRVGQGQRPQPVPRLPGYPQRLPAGGQHPHIIGAEQQPAAQLRRRADHVLAVIQHQQQLPPGQRVRQRVGRRHRGQVPDPQRRRHRGRHLRRVPHRRQLRQPHPVSEPAGHLPGDLAGQPRLPGTPRPGHRHQPVLTQLAGDLVHHRWPGPRNWSARPESRACFPPRRSPQTAPQRLP